MTIASSQPVVNIDCLAKDKWTKNKSQNKNHYDSIFIAHYHVADDQGAYLMFSSSNTKIAIANCVVYQYVNATQKAQFTFKNVWSYERYYFRKGKKTKRVLVSYSAPGNSVPFTFVQKGGQFSMLDSKFPNRFTKIVEGAMLDRYNNPLFPGLDFIDIEENQWMESEYFRLVVQTYLNKSFSSSSSTRKKYDN